MKKMLFVGLLAALCATFMVGCGSGMLSEPPISVTFRGSLMDFGKTQVMRITNRSGSETLVVTVYVENKKSNQHKSHVVKIGPGDTVELGRLEMNWYFETGETYSIKADGYGIAHTGTVP